jgi:hypothetical protein
MSERLEEWRVVPGMDPRFEVSDHGNVRSWVRGFRGGKLRADHSRALRPQAGGKRNGVTRYLMVTPLDADGARRPSMIHVLVMAAFVGPKPSGMQVCHNDGCGTNNKLSNLRYDTPSANCADRHLHGTARVGETAPSAVLSESQAREAIALRGIVPQRTLAKWLGVEHAAIAGIQRGAYWAHLPRPALTGNPSLLNHLVNRSFEGRRGEASYQAKLTNAAVREIRARLMAGHTQGAIAADYGVTRRTIWSIALGRSWQHVEAV